MSSPDRLRLGNLILTFAWIVAKLDSLSKWKRSARVGIQATLFVGGLGIIAGGLSMTPTGSGPRELLIAVGKALTFSSGGLGAAEVLYYVSVRRYLRTRTIGSLGEALRNYPNSKRSLIAARMDHTLEEWLSWNCPRLNYRWVRDELERMDLG